MASFARVFSAFPHRPGLDWLGGTLSVLCLVHCLVLPSLLVAFTALAPFGGEAVHLGLTLAILPLSLLTFGSGYQFHKQRRVLWLGGLGCLFLLAALGLEGVGGEWVEKGLTVLGAFFLISGHSINLRAKPCNDACCPAEGQVDEC
ncbi:MerC domain-containing protein [Acanthopleuribacter pedis]|uniref:MerC domain-containing protein n=1 Tax=Acanthopleuribacter pedis TaxID=442870 RepID=A0A8J7Q7V7_9BACT|nr:MerC domain-containing protein [Acanthopleuribacter pedis]MBO1318484.1 MerC domain-containing protein [Acanthopleuribacter pedis]